MQSQHVASPLFEYIVGQLAGKGPPNEPINKPSSVSITGNSAYSLRTGIDIRYF